MTFGYTTPSRSAPPPLPVRPAHGGGITLTLGGVLAIGSVFLPFSVVGEYSVTLVRFRETTGALGSFAGFGDFNLIFASLVVGGGLAVVMGMVAALDGGKNTKLAGCITGLVAMLCVGIIPAKLLTSGVSELFRFAGVGVYTLAAAPLVILVGVLALLRAIQNHR